jgi:raffinose/stachyose/melibiose transport system permease protein
VLVFDYVWITTRGGPAGATEVVGTLLYKEAFENFEAGYAAALGLSMTVVCGLVGLFYVLLRRRGWEV